MYATTRCFVVGIPAPDGEWIFQVTANGLSGGAFRTRILNDKICIMDHAFKSSSNDEAFEKDIFKEVFTGLVEKKKLPVYFNPRLMTHSDKQVLKDMGAIEVTEIGHAWPNDVNMIKLEVKKQ